MLKKSVIVLMTVAAVGCGVSAKTTDGPPAPVKQAPAVTVKDPAFTESAIYLRDAYGRCLRLQLQPMENGRLFVLALPNEACAKRERTRKP